MQYKNGSPHRRARARMITPGPQPFMAVRGLRLTLDGKPLERGTVIRFCANPGVIANWIPAGIKGGGIVDIAETSFTTPDGLVVKAGDNLLRSTIIYGTRYRTVNDPANPGQTAQVIEPGTEGGPLNGDTVNIIVGNVMTNCHFTFIPDSWDNMLVADMQSAPAGDVNLDGTVDIGDLEAVVDLVARGDETARVWQETVIDQATAGSIDISDLQRLVDHVYFGFPMTIRQER